MKKIAVVGCKGRMGSLICKALEGEFDIFGIDVNQSLYEIPVPDLVIDFAGHESSLISAKFCEDNNVPLIIGSTGQTEEENRAIEDISKKILVIKRANFSCGIELMKQSLEKILTLHPTKIEIIEKHHVHKKDKPSGTAIELKEFIENSFSGEIQITSIREGEEMGEHSVAVYFEDECLQIKHNAFSRMAFVKGVVLEVRKILN